MKKHVKLILIMFVALTVVVGLSSTASAAGCVDLPKKVGTVLIPALRSPLTLTASPAANRSVAPAATEGPQIVGLWQFEFKSVGNSGGPLHIPDGAVLDAGFAQWHSDGTEIMNSSRDPVTGSFCLGAWAAAGDRTYKLNHFALSWDNTGQLCHPPIGSTNCFVGPANIREEVTVDPHGDTYEGTVTIDQYDNAQHLLFHLTGKVTGRRITAD